MKTVSLLDLVFRLCAAYYLKALLDRLQHRLLFILSLSTQLS
jgi:hypothetical protein